MRKSTKKEEKQQQQRILHAALRAALAAAAAICAFQALTSSGSLSPIQMARSVWLRKSDSSSFPSSSTVLGWINADSGPRQMASHETKAPNCAGVNRFTSNMATGCGPTGMSQKR